MERLDFSSRVAVIGEVAQAHDGSLGTAHAFIDVVADAGANAVKFQTHIAAVESRPHEPWRVPFSRQDASRFDYWKRMEFAEEHWLGLRRHAEDRGLCFLSSPFSPEAVDLLERVGVSAWKVASGEAGNLPLVKRLAGSGLPLLLSTGMSPWDEMDAAVTVARGAGVSELAVLQCTSAYPTPPEDVGLNVIAEIHERYGCAAGLSDHSATIFPSLGAVSLGARVVEVHVTLTRSAFGPDVVASVTPVELAELVRGVRFLERTTSSPIAKDVIAERLVPLRTMFGKSLVARRNLPAGTVLSHDDLALKKPADGLPANRLENVVGRTLSRRLSVDESLTEAHLSPA